MRDWEQVARERLRGLGFDCGDEVAAELGAFLDDACRELVRSGTEPERAAALTLERAGDWSQLVRGLRRLEEVPMERAGRLWIPGLVNAALAFGLLRAATAIGLEPFVRLRGYSEFVIYWQWLLVVALLAGGAAWWSARHGAGVMERLVAGVAPSLAIFSLVLLLFVASSVVEFIVALVWAVDTGVPIQAKLQALIGLLATWVVVPGFASLVGALPFIHRPPTLSLPT